MRKYSHPYLAGRIGLNGLNQLWSADIADIGQGSESWSVVRRGSTATCYLFTPDCI
jgi:hypothetical protein